MSGSKASKTKTVKAPFGKAVVMSVLAFVMAAGGYGGYQVFQNYETYGVNFDGRLHEVVEVVDGDTLVVENGIRVRLLGIDAPEVDECFGDEARSGLSALVLGQKVRLEKDQTATDQYGRLLRYAFVANDNPETDDVFVNMVLLEDGFAENRYTKPDRLYLQQFQGAEREAEDGKKGMWGACDMSARQAEDGGGEEASEPYDDECVIKGNIGKEYTKDYFLPGCPNYKRVKVDERKGERWFCTEEEAVEAGWQMSAGCANIHQFQ